jgi:site-specific recombinase XerD
MPLPMNTSPRKSAKSRGSSTNPIGRSVSPYSHFEDTVWRFTKGSIHWKRQPVEVPHDDFDQLMEPVRLLIYILLTEENLATSTLHYFANTLKQFASWLISRPLAIREYKNVTPSQLVEYLDYQRKRPPLKQRRRTPNHKAVCKETFRRIVRTLALLYHYRDRLSDGLTSPPINANSRTRAPDGLGEPDWLAKTLPIPDKDHQQLLSAAVVLIRNESQQVARRLKALVKHQAVTGINELSRLNRDDELLRRKLKKYRPAVKNAVLRFFDGGLLRVSEGTSLSLSDLAKEARVASQTCALLLYTDRGLRVIVRKRSTFFGKDASWDLELNRALRLLQAACFIIIATSTGMRLGEILAIKPGCIVKRKLNGKEDFFYWLKSTLLKTSPNKTGEECYWLCGELSVEAVRVLENLSKIMPSSQTTSRRNIRVVEDSLFRSYGQEGLARRAIPLLQQSLYCSIKEFIASEKLEIAHVHPHQFRRSFARNIIRWTNTPILALQRHFKHCSLLMTDYYIGVDEQLLQMYLQEQEEDSRQRLRQILAGECAGPGGRISQKRLLKMADNEELPLNFRGRERLGTIEQLVDEVCDGGVLAYKCGEVTTCLYVPGLAECGDDGPKAHDCHPHTCPNSHILLDDVPFYLSNVVQNGTIYAQLPLKEKVGPHGIFLQERITADIFAIAPLLHSYEEKLEDMDRSYECLDDSAKTTAFGSTLKKRIDRDREALKQIESRKGERP